MHPYFRAEHMLHPKSASQIQYSQRPELFPYLYSFKFNQIASIVCFIIPCHPSKIDNSSGLFQIHHSKKSLSLFSPHPLFRQLLLPQFRLHQHLFERALLHFRQFIPLDFPFRHEHGYRSVNPDFIIGDILFFLFADNVRFPNQLLNVFFDFFELPASLASFSLLVPQEAQDRAQVVFYFHFKILVFVNLRFLERQDLGI